MTNPTRIQIRRGTTTQWNSSPTLVLASGEIGFVESGADKGKFKIGDGTTQWSLLSYYPVLSELSVFATASDLDALEAKLVDGAPGALDTLNELAAALGDDANYAATITTALGTKLPLSGGTMTGAIAMGTNKITGLGTPTENEDASTKLYVDTLQAFIEENYSLDSHTHDFSSLTNFDVTLPIANGEVLMYDQGYWKNRPLNLTDYATNDSPQLTSATIQGITFQDVSDATKQATFSLSSITSSTTQTLTIPDESGIILTSSTPSYSKIVSRLTSDTSSIADTETTVISYTIPANTSSVGDIYKISAYYTRSGTNASTSQGKVKIGTGTSMVTVGSTSGSASSGKFEFIIAVKSTGTLGKINAFGESFYSLATPQFANGTEQTLNTTINQTLNFTYKSGTSTNSAIFSYAVIEQIKS